MIHTEIKEYDNAVCWKIGQRIQEKRLEKHMAAVDVAEYLHINKNQLSRIENGKANCTVPQLYILAQLLDCSVDYLILGNVHNSKYSQEQEACIEALVASFRKVRP